MMCRDVISSTHEAPGGRQLGDGSRQPSLFVYIMLRPLLPAEAPRRRARLELRLRGLLEGVHRLQEPQPAVLDGRNILVLLVAGLLVLLLQALHELLEVLLELLRLALRLLDHRLSLLRAHRLEVRDALLLLLVAEVDVLRAARGLQVARELLQVVEGPAALVVLEVAGVTVLDRGVAPDANVAAEVLPSGSAVHVGNQHSRVVLVLAHQLVPGGLHVLAVASPGREELDEDGLPRGGAVEGLLR